MNGVTRPLSLQVRLEKIDRDDARGGMRAHFAAETKLRRKDFGVAWSSAMDRMLGDAITIRIEIEVIKQQ